MDLASAEGSDKLYRCQKSNRDVPLAEPACAEPKAYCKWRAACPVHALEKEHRRRAR